jgi:hypothetical protein
MGHGYAAAINYFDGTSTRTLLYSYDLEVSGSDLFVLTSDGQIQVNRDLDRWQSVTAALDGARSLARLDDGLYVGTATSELWVARLGS